MESQQAGSKVLDNARHMVLREGHGICELLENFAPQRVYELGDQRTLARLGDQVRPGAFFRLPLLPGQHAEYERAFWHVSLYICCKYRARVPGRQTR